MRTFLTSALVAAVGAAAVGMVFAQEATTTPQQVINALEGVFGKQPGVRKNHAKGTCAAGSFVGNTAAAAYSRSLLFKGDAIPVVARFSLGGGNPAASDADRGPRGLGLEFRIPSGGIQHITMINSPAFFTSVPKGFVDNLLAAKPDPKTGKPDPAALKAFAASDPASVTFNQYYATHNPPPSYANAPFYGIHTFRFIGQDGRVTLVRWRFVPQDGEKGLTAEELAKATADFLEPALIARVKQGPVQWKMLVTIGEPGDTENDATIEWPKGRKEIEAGTLSITSATPQQGGECYPINYDPLVMADGIQPTRDPILLFRSPSYAASFALRSADK